MDWDWQLIVEIAILVVAATGTILIWAERTERRRDRGLPTMPRPQWRVLAAPANGTLRIEAANDGAAASVCCVVMHVDSSLYAGTFPLSEQQPWAPQTLRLFDVLDERAEAHSLLCVARNLDGVWSGIAPNKYIEAVSETTVPFEVVDILRRATGRRYACSVSSDGIVAITPAVPNLRSSPEAAG